MSSISSAGCQRGGGRDLNVNQQSFTQGSCDTATGKTQVSCLHARAMMFWRKWRAIACGVSFDSRALIGQGGLLAQDRVNGDVADRRGPLACIQVVRHWGKGGVAAAMVENSCRRDLHPLDLACGATCGHAVPPHSILPQILVSPIKRGHIDQRVRQVPPPPFSFRSPAGIISNV